MNSKREYIKNNLDVINEMISKNRPKFEISRVLGVKYETLNKYLKELGINYNGNQNRKGIPHLNERKDIKYFLSENGKNISASFLRKRLIEEGLKEEKCEKCGNTHWMGSKIPLELHHINGNHYDNRIENLQILCSNCHGIEHNYSNVSIKNDKVNTEFFNKILSEDDIIENKKTFIKKEKKEKNKRFCIKCGKELKKGQLKYCSKDCYNEDNSVRPSYEELVEKLDNLKHNLSAIGRFYKVSDVAVKKWLKLYKIE